MQRDPFAITRLTSNNVSIVHIGPYPRLADESATHKAYPVADKARVPSGMLSLLRCSSTHDCVYRRTRRRTWLYDRATCTATFGIRFSRFARVIASECHAAVVTSDTDGYKAFGVVSSSLRGVDRDSIMAIGWQ